MNIVKKVLKIIGIGIVSIIILLFICAACVDDEVETDNTQTITESVVENDVTEPETKPTEPATDKDTINATLAILNDNMYEFGDWTYDEDNKWYAFTPNDEMMQNFTILYAQRYNAEIQSSWENTKEAMCAMTETYHITAVIVNAENSDNILLCVAEGQILYDFMTE